MTSSAALVLPLLAALLWLLTRRRPQAGTPSLFPTTPAAPAAWVSPRVGVPGPAAAPAAAQPDRGAAPQPLRGRQQRLNALGQALVGTPSQRLAAVQQLAQWGDRAGLPLLQRGLRDPHPEVVCAAAAAMARFRGRSAAVAGSATAAAAMPVPLRLPHNGRPQV